MLKISEAVGSELDVTLRLDGQVTDRWLDVLRKSCDGTLNAGRRLTLDIGNVSFADADGIALLRSLVDREVRLLNASPFLTQQLRRTTP